MSRSFPKFPTQQSPPTPAGYVLEKARLTQATGATGAVTLIQRFGSALNANIHFHMLFLDGAYLSGTKPPIFRRIGAPSALELEALVARIAERIARALERKGLLMRDCENSYLAFDPAGGPMDDLLGHSITYRVAMGPRAGQKVFALQTVPSEPPQEQKKGVAQAAGFSLHAGLGIEADARAKLERLCRYVSRPAIAAERLALTERGDVRLQLKTAYRDGTTHVILEPLDLLDVRTARRPARRAIRALTPFAVKRNARDHRLFGVGNGFWPSRGFVRGPTRARAFGHLLQQSRRQRGPYFFSSARAPASMPARPMFPS